MIDGSHDHPRRVGVLLLAGLVGLVVAACGIVGEAGSGDLVTTPFELEGFDAVDASAAFDVEVEIGDEFAVEVTSDDNLVDRLDVSVQGDTLRLRIDGPVRNGTFQAKVTLPALTAVEADGASSVELGSIEAESLSIEANGASSVGGPFTVGRLSVQLDGASTFDGSGTADELMAELNGSSELRAEGLTATTATIELNGASEAAIGVAGALTAALAGSSTLSASGSATTVEIDADGSSDFHGFELAGGTVTVTVDGSSSAEVNVTGTLAIDASGSSDVRWTGSGTIADVQVDGSSSVERA